MTQTVPGFDRLTVELDKLGGSPYVRGYRFGVDSCLSSSPAGMTFEEIHGDFPFLEHAHQVFAYAAALAQRDFYLPLQESA